MFKISFTFREGNPYNTSIGENVKKFLWVLLFFSFNSYGKVFDCVHL
jgi:hypothetical protein